MAVGWAGIAYWADPGYVLDRHRLAHRAAPANAQNVVYHEFQHYLQYSYNSGCYGFLRPNYLSGSAAGDAEFVEGYADLAMDAVDATVDNTLYNNFVNAYNPLGSFYDKNYWDVFNKYYLEQVGHHCSNSDPVRLPHGRRAVRITRSARLRGTLYVLDTLIPSLRTGLSRKSSSWTSLPPTGPRTGPTPPPSPSWSIPTTIRSSYGQVPLAYDGLPVRSIARAGPGRQRPTNGRPPTTRWTRPQPGCDFVSVAVDGKLRARSWGSTSWPPTP